MINFDTSPDKIGPDHPELGFLVRTGNCGLSCPYILAQTFEHSSGRSFQRIHRASSMLGVSHFAHLPPGSILVQVPDKVKLTAVAVVSRNTAILLQTLKDELPGLTRMVTKLNTVQRKWKGNVNILDIEEDDCVDD
ncbi:hypothetical protein B0H11DRAFT_1930745 [Mycena galericulata]|nr:hypothetical protein B0H11DRAFT_1930745 [Mycena galericulata]